MTLELEWWFFKESKKESINAASLNCTVTVDLVKSDLFGITPLLSESGLNGR